MDEIEIDTDRVDDAVLALLYLTWHDDDYGLVRAWKSHDWDALGRLHDKGMIGDPVGRAKSVLLTPEGKERCRDLFETLFARRRDALLPPAGEGGR